MRLHLPSIPREIKIALSVVILILCVLAQRQFRGMDHRFFQPSVRGVQGLALYLIGDYKDSAVAYRMHFQELAQHVILSESPAYQALIQGRLNVVKDLSQQALERDPNNIDALLNLSELALRDQAHDQALELLAKVLQLEKDQYDALLLSSIAHTSKQAYSTAIQDLTRALRWNRTETRFTSFLATLEMTGELADGDHAQRPLCLLAHYYRYLRIFDETNARPAIRFADQAIEARDHPSEAYATQAIIALRQQHPDEALTLAQQAIAIDARNAAAYRIVATVYGDRGDLEGEYQARLGEMKAASDDEFYTISVFHFLIDKVGDYYKALEVAKQLIVAVPDNASALAQVGYFHSLIGEYEQAVDYFNQAIAREPQNPEFYGKRGLARSLEEQGLTEAAVVAYKKASALAPRASQPHQFLGALYYRKRRLSEAIVEYEQAVQLGDFGYYTLIPLCQSYDRLGRYRPAIACYQEVLARFPNDTLATRQLAHMQRNIKNKAVQG